MQQPDYEALDVKGYPYVRPAKVVGELPTACVEARLGIATEAIAKLLGMPAKQRIFYGAPVFEAFGFSRAQAKKHGQAKLLLTKGESLSLELCSSGPL